MTKKKLLEVRNLKQYFPIDKKSVVKAVDNMTFDIYEGETFGLVGESGSGKSTTGRTIIRLYDPTEGEIIFDGKNISDKNKTIEILKKCGLTPSVTLCSLSKANCKYMPTRFK